MNMDKKMKKNISTTEHAYKNALAKSEYLYNYLYKGKPVFARPNRAGFVAYEALYQITEGAIGTHDFDAEFHKATMSDACPGNVDSKIRFVMGWFLGYLNIELVEE